MAFCISKNSKKKSSQPAPHQLPKGPPVRSPTMRRTARDEGREKAAQALALGNRLSFPQRIEKARQRFSKQDLQDLEKRFKRNSTWVVVDSDGANVRTASARLENHFK